MKIIDEHLYALGIPITIFYLWLKYTHCKIRKCLQHTILSQYSHIVYGLVCVFSVMLCANLWIEVGLVNGALGTVVAICYESDQYPPCLPIRCLTLEVSAITCLIVLWF